MKKVFFIFLMGPLLFGSFTLTAQNWLTAGNALTANGTLGSSTNFSLLFKTNNTERGRLTNAGLWGFGTTAPNSRVHINGSSTQVSLRVENNSVTKLLVKNGVTIGANITPPLNGLYVAGNTGIGTATPENTLHVFKGSAGTVTGDINSPFIVENSTHSYISILAPDTSATGIIFGKPASNVSGGIFYNDQGNPNSLQFRTGGNITQMVIDASGGIGLGTNPGEYALRIKQNRNSIFCLDLVNAYTGNDWNIWPDQFTPGSLTLWRNSVFKGNFDGTTGAYKSISDERLKTNIKPMGAMLNKISQLKPSVYQFKNSTDKQEYNGFIAQEVSKLFPNMVSHNVFPDNRPDVYTMDYSQFGVLAIKGIQELLPIVEEQKIVIDNQKEEIETLKDRISKLEAVIANIIAANGNANKIINTSLEQNKPNPFNKNTIIRYSLPQGIKGQINIHDQTGKLLKVLRANENGYTELSGSELAAGTYGYSLVVNGKVAVTKQMVVIK